MFSFSPHLSHIPSHVCLQYVQWTLSTSAKIDIANTSQYKFILSKILLHRFVICWGIQWPSYGHAGLGPSHHTLGGFLRWPPGKLFWQQEHLYDVGIALQNLYEIWYKRKNSTKRKNWKDWIKPKGRLSVMCVFFFVGLFSRWLFDFLTFWHSDFSNFCWCCWLSNFVIIFDILELLEYSTWCVPQIPKSCH